MGLDKQLRMQELALENKLPYVQLVESAGANLMTYRSRSSSRRQPVPQPRAPVGRRAAGDHGDARLVDRGRRLPDRPVGLHRDGARPLAGLPRRPAAAEGRHRRDRHRGGAGRRPDAHLDLGPGRLPGRGRPRRDPASRARSWPASTGTATGRGAAAPLQAAALRRRRAARHHADGPQAPGRHEAGDRAASPTTPSSSSSARTTAAPPCAATSAIEGLPRRASSPTTARSTPPAPPRRRTSSRPAASRARRSSTCNNTTGFMVGRDVRGGRHDQARLEDDPGRDQRHGAADHDLLRRLVRRRQLRHVRPRLPSALLLLVAERQDRGDGRRAGGQDHGHRDRGRHEAQGRGRPGQARRRWSAASSSASTAR